MRSPVFQPAQGADESRRLQFGVRRSIFAEFWIFRFGIEGQPDCCDVLQIQQRRESGEDG